MGKTVLLLKNGLGDVAMALPLVSRATEQIEENSCLLILVKDGLSRQLLAHLPGSEKQKVIEIGGVSRSRTLRTMLIAARGRLTGIDLLLAPHGNPSKSLYRFAGLLSPRRAVLPSGRGQPQRRDWHFIEKRTGEHKVQYYLRFGEAIGLKDGNKDGLKAFRDKFCGEERGKAVVLAPGSGIVESHKRWPAENYRSLIEELLRLDNSLRCVLLGGRSEEPLLDECRPGKHSGRVTVRIPRSISESLELLGESALLVSGCTGPIHLAALVGTPVVGIYGPTNPGFTGPWSEQVRIVRRGLGCSPCYRPDFIRGCGNPVCISGISVEEVFKHCSLVLKGRFEGYPAWYETTRATEPDVRQEGCLDDRSLGFR